MIGGNIPGETRVLSIALFDHVEAFDYAKAHVLAISLLLGSMILLAGIYLVNLPKNIRHKNKPAREGSTNKAGLP
jgi:molybdate transport system permease protein